MTAYKKTEEGLKEAAQRKEAFLALLAHELRDSLTPLRNAVQVLTLQTKPISPPYLREVRTLIEHHLERFTRLANHLLDMAWVSSGQMTLQKNRIDITYCANQAIKTIRPILDERGHRLILQLASMPLPVEADAARLTQVIENLLHNAAKYTKEGGRIVLTTHREGTEVVLKVHDNGMGIPLEWLPTIFDWPGCSNRPLNHPHGGLNLSLNLSKSLVEMHGGRISASSPGPGQGSTFVVRLPLASATASPFPPALEKSLPAASRRRILIVDDNWDIAHSFEILLNLWGYHVQTASDGLTALEFTHSFQPEVILLDISLPDMEGYEVARRLRMEYGQQAQTRCPDGPRPGPTADPGGRI